MLLTSTPELNGTRVPPSRQFFRRLKTQSSVAFIRCSSSRSSAMDNRQEPPKRVVVCGGGVIGVCTAYFLSKKGAAVTIVEKSSIACAASGKAGGFLALDWCDGGAMSSLARASFNLHRSLAEELNGFEVYGYRPVTTLSLSVTESSSSSSSGASYRSPGPSLPSWVNGPAKSPKTIGTTETTAQVHPQLFTRTLLYKVVEEYGGQLVIGKLEKVEVAEGRARSVVLEGGREINADAVVLALGPWTSKLSLLSSMFRISGLKAHSIVLGPKDPNAITPHALFLSYYPAQGGKPMDPEVYPRPTGRFLCILQDFIFLFFCDFKFSEKKKKKVIRLMKFWRI